MATNPPNQFGIDVYSDIQRRQNAYINQLINQYRQILKSQSMAAAASTYSQAQQRLQFYAWQQSVNNHLNRRLQDAQTKVNVDRGINFMVDVSMKQFLGDSSFVVAEQSKTNAGIIGKVYSAAVRQRWRQIANINRRVADEAIDAMVRKYDTVHKAGRGRNAFGAPTDSGELGYRASQRFSGGVLRRALSSPLQASASLTGVSFLNETLLDTTARQWARLNFGAGPRANTAPRGFNNPLSIQKNFNLKFFQSVLSESNIAPTTLQHPYGPKGAFKIPTGIWLDRASEVQSPNPSRRGTDAFFPETNVFGALKNARKQNPGLAVKLRDKGGTGFQVGKITQGVAAWGFIEAGIASLSRNFPAANTAWMLQIFREAQVEAGAGIPGKLAISMARTNAIASSLEADLRRYLSVQGKAGQNRLNFLNSLGNVALP